MSLRLLSAADRVATSWKNGGGVTYEIATYPDDADLAGFDWRMSVARVEEGGPFSAFPGVDRLMLILDGRLCLQIAGAAPLSLDPSSPVAEFPGDAVVSALTPDAPVTDVNVMVRRGRYTASLERRSFSGAAGVVCQDITLMLALADDVSIALGRQEVALGPADAARIDGPRGALARLRSAGPAEVVIAHVNVVR